MRRFFCNALLLLLASAVTEASSDTCSIVAEQAQIQDIIDWVRSEGGFFNDKLEVRRADPADPTSYYGIFATNTIQPKEALLRVSASSMIRAVKDEQQVSDEEHASELCDLTHVVLKELRSGEQSQYAPYVKYLLDQKRGQLPSSWTEPAKELMREINPADVHNMVDWIEMEFENTGCIRKGDAFEQQALALVVQRRWESIMVPVYDIISNAKDPKKINMDTTSVFGPKGLRTWATTLIEAGEELFTSYSNVWGTSEILRNFGFVEPYPRKFQMSQVLFEIDEAIGETGDTSQEIEWINLDGETPSYEAIESMKEESKRLQDLQHNGTLEDNRRMMPEKEWNAIFQYHQALANAVDVAIELATGDLHAADNHCDEDGNCGIRYEDLNEEIQSSDDYYFMTYQCETLAFGIDHFLTVGKSESHYQLMNYYHDPETKEMCFHIDGVHQQCTSYRPHYHEMGVHLPARYLPEGLKRVLWIGGGDAMLLHEFLKYPELELAVGLELDQKVTRGAFKYFGAQPHWDNEKVQWWYGDASKSLLMLPEDYFGSFDMVLVDLSDTVLSLSVTKEMDIIGALSLLLKPDGIFVMNELVRLFLVVANSLIRTRALTLFILFPAVLQESQRSVREHSSNSH
jgi:spermidine synthase